MAHRHEAKGSSERRGFLLEITFEWNATRIGTIWSILCLIYIHDLEEVVASKILKFANDTNFFLIFLGKWGVNNNCRMTLTN